MFEWQVLGVGVAGGDVLMLMLLLPFIDAGLETEHNKRVDFSSPTRSFDGKHCSIEGLYLYIVSKLLSQGITTADMEDHRKEYDREEDDREGTPHSSNESTPPRFYFLFCRQTSTSA